MGSAKAKSPSRDGLTEYQIHAAVVQYLRLQGLTFVHPANESRGTIGWRAKLKRMGLSPGCPDILIFTPPPRMPGFVGMAMELKSLRGRLSTAQVWWINELDRLGWYAVVARGLDQSLALLREAGY